MEQDALEVVFESTVEGGVDNPDTRRRSEEREGDSCPSDEEWKDSLTDPLESEERDPLQVTGIYESALLVFAELPTNEVERYEPHQLELTADSVVRILNAITRVFENQPAFLPYIIPAGTSWQLPVPDVMEVPALAKLSPDEALQAQKGLMHSSFARYQENRAKFKEMSARLRDLAKAAAKKKEREDNIVSLEAQIQLLRGGQDLPVQPLPTPPACLMDLVNPRQDVRPQFRHRQKRYNYRQFKYEEYKRNRDQ